MTTADYNALLSDAITESSAFDTKCFAIDAAYQNGNFPDLLKTFADEAAKGVSDVLGGTEYVQVARPATGTSGSPPSDDAGSHSPSNAAPTAEEPRVLSQG
jgi:hypothetical protein